MAECAESDTIVAVATPPGRGGLGIVRLSGPQALAIAGRVLGLDVEGEGRWLPRQARRRLFRDTSGAVLDEVFGIYFAAPHSYTTEDVVEISAHGSPPLLAALVAASQAQGARLAEPGEFTRRAFLHGRIDLTQAEAVRDLIAAQTLLQARSAARQLQGAVAQQLAPLKSDLLELIARLEAGIDFADDDVTVISDAALAAALAGLGHDTSRALAGFAHGRLVREGLALAILGRPNVGKSSLFNRLVGQERAIVTSTPGTTRDLVAECLEIEGVPVRLVDTAGIRAAESEEAERLGMAKSWQAGAEADVVLAVFDASRELSSEDASLLRRVADWPKLQPILNKCDLPPRTTVGRLEAALAAAGRELASEPVCEVSALTGAGVDTLRRHLGASALPGAASDGAWLTNARQAERLQAVAAALERAQASRQGGMPHEALLVDLHQARHELDALTGASDIEDILGVIFATFCVGK